MVLPEVGKQTFFKVRKSQIRKFLGSLRYSKFKKNFGVLHNSVSKQSWKYSL